MKYQQLKKLQETHGKKYVCLFGAGLVGCTWAYDLLKVIGFHIDFFCDNKKHNTVVNGITVISPEELYLLKDVLVFITTTHRYQSEIKIQLEKNGINSIVQVDYLFLQSFINSLLEMDDQGLQEKFRCILDDQDYISRQFEYRVGYRPNLIVPRTFNEKIQWLKLHDRNPEYTNLVDKYEVKKYIAAKVGKEYVIPTLEIYDDFNQIDFSKMPRQFVLKCTHDSGSSVICKDKEQLDVENAKEILHSGLKRNFYWVGREWPYKNIKPRIIAEEYLSDLGTEELIDYKLLCMNGKVEVSFTCTNRFNTQGLCVNFYDKKWNSLPFERHYPKRKEEIEKPKEYEEMVRLAEILSEGKKFVRIDFYVVNEQIYIGEMTFYPGNGMEEFTPVEWDFKLGKMIELGKTINS